MRKTLLALMVLFIGASPAYAISWQNTLVVLIGSSVYDNAPALDFVENDLDAMQAYAREGLGVPKEQIHVIRNATLANYVATFSQGGLLDQEMKRLQANLLVYVSSHGLPNSAGESSLLPQNGSPSIPATLFRRDDILAAMHRAKSELPDDRRFLAIFDACFSGNTRVGKISDAKAPPLGAAMTVNGINVLTAADSQSVAFADKRAELSGLTSTFLRAVSGQADETEFGGNADGEVSGGELAAFIKRTIGTITASNQKPEANIVDDIVLPQFVVERLQEEIEEQRLASLWKAGNFEQSALPTAANITLAHTDEELGGLYRKFDEIDSNLQAFEARCAGVGSCEGYAEQISKVRRQLDVSYFALEDQRSWITETLGNRRQRCRGYLKQCQHLKGLDAGYACLNEKRALRECRLLSASDALFDQNLIEQTAGEDSLAGWRACADQCRLEINRADARAKILEIEQLAVRRATDLAAWEKAKALNVPDAYAKYLKTCNAVCAFRNEAEATLASLSRLNSVATANANNVVERSKRTASTEFERVPFAGKVRILQEFLNAWNCHAGAVDGVIGARTKHAYERFSRKNGLAVADVSGANVEAVLEAIFSADDKGFRHCRIRKKRHPTHRKKASRH